MKLFIKPILPLLLFALLLLPGRCVYANDVSKEDSETWQVVKKEEPKSDNIYDNMSWYEGLDADSVITMYLTVSSGNEADGTLHTWKEINTYSAYDYQDMNVDRYKVDGLLQIDETGGGITEDSFGYGEEVPNVSVQVRGQTSSAYLQKNYKIRIKQGKGEFRQQRTLNLNKHMVDPYRFANKLSYDLLNQIPQLLGGQTQFVHLYVKDLTETASGDYQDYGLYTMVEQVNSAYLRHHGLDEKGQLYKVTFFEWDKYDAVMTSSEDEDFDKEAFEEYMEIKGDGDTGKLREVVQQVQNFRIPIDETIDKYFSAENLTYWMAFNILIGNYDTGSRNLFLYSPLNDERFYFICWDMDSAFQKGYIRSISYSEAASWEQGITQYLGLSLMRRMFKEEKYRDMLTDAVDDLYKNYVNKETVDQRAAQYAKVTESYLYSSVDKENALLSKDEFTHLVKQLGKEVRLNYKTYKKSLTWPWPFFVDLPNSSEDGKTLTLSWGTSYHPDGECVTYSYQLARDYTFKDVIAEDQGLLIPNTEITKPEAGRYYLKVVASDESGNTMDCFDYFPVEHVGKVYGCYAFDIGKDGSIKYFTGEEEE